VEWASQLGVLIFLAASGASGGRLLWRGLRTGGLHERLLGVTYFVGGPLGYVPLLLVLSGATPDEWTRPLRAFGHLNLELSALALYAFNRRVFRPDSRVWSAGTAVASAGLGAGWLGLVFVDGLEGRTLEGSAPYWFDFCFRAAAYAWAAAESLRQHARARRRLALGLVDPVLVDRFLLWGVAMAAVTGMFANSFAGLLVPGDAPAPLQFLIDGVLAVIASAAMWATFFPPRWYVAQLRTRALAPLP
jgi:hypothetical protein